MRWRTDSPMRRGILAVIGTLALQGGAFAVDQSGQPESSEVRHLALEECIRIALLQNRTLQIERLNPAIAQSWLSASYGYYDPIFSVEARSEDSEDTGGFDPADFSRDAVFSADSEVARGGLIGFLPGGLSYSISGGYAHSEGLRNGLNFESYSLQTSFMLRQPLLRNFWIDQGRMTIQVNRQNLAITELGVLFVAMDVINQVQHAYYELACALGELRVRRELLETRRQLLSGVRRKIEMGTLTVLDERLAEAQVANVEADLTLADNAIRLAENELRSLLGDSWTNTVDVRLETTDPLLVMPERFDLPACWQQGLANRPDLAQLRQDVEKSATDLKFRRNQLFPSLDFVAGHSRKGASTGQLLPPLRPSASSDEARDQISDGDAPTDMVGIVFSVPLSRTAERANFRASKHARAQAELRVKQFEEQVMREISDALHTARARLDRVGLIRRARELSETALEAEEQKLAGGKSTLFFVLQLQNDLASARSAELRTKADYNQALSQLRFAEATLLERWGLRVEFK
ncbi:MAG: TolC family protein [Verrucomicrobia bacterium]|nr:TolC family protein [Verrucomicrobiota bacterium]